MFIGVGKWVVETATLHSQNFEATKILRNVTALNNTGKEKGRPRDTQEERSG